MIKGQVISGEFGKIAVRQRSGTPLELGELLITEARNKKILLQVYDLMFGSQISQQNRELISGMKLEQDVDGEIFESELRNYTLAFVKNLVTIEDSKAVMCKTLPAFFSDVREVTRDDLRFLGSKDHAFLLGNLRSGKSTLNLPINLDGKKVLSHHILIAGTTGRGKSVLVTNLLWNSIENDYCGMLVLDPHDEYYGKDRYGLKDHKDKERVRYYTPKDPPPGTNTLKINIEHIKPMHFNGVIDFSDPQKQALNLYYKEFGTRWIEAIILEKKCAQASFRDDTLAVIKRQLLYLLDIEISNNKVIWNGVFDINGGVSTIADISRDLEDSKVVIIDTSGFAGQIELLIGSLVTHEVFRKYRYYKRTGTLSDKPIISIVLEEAPRVLGKEVLEKGSNIFSTIAREGRKFKVGLMAITQLPSLIPREILANMNTKIILGIEMKPERTAIMESASNDLSQDDRTIASLDVGEALVSSNFARFAIPLKIPLFEDMVRKSSDTGDKTEQSFSGINLG